MKYIASTEVKFAPMKEENLLRRVLGPWLTVNYHQTHVATTLGLAS